MGNAIFIIWRESAEALLVVGILYAWLARRPDRAAGLRYLWGGVAAGVGLAVLLALVVLGLVRALPESALDYFQVAMMLMAAALIVQMVFWMRRHGRTFKSELESRMEREAGAANWWGMLAVVALAVGRETAETVVFLYGVGLGELDAPQFALVLAVGLGFAFLTFWLLQRGGRALSWRHFFRVSEILLLLLAGGLLVSGVDHLIGLGVLPSFGDQLWNTSALLDDSTPVGSFVASMTGYRSQPSLLPLACLAVFWGTVLYALRDGPAAGRRAPPDRVKATG
jgi:high-affinity iron transporter